MLPPILFFRPVRYESKIATPTMTPMTVMRELDLAVLATL
jgi:hypothetical protein